jgi:hypothetical protein
MCGRLTFERFALITATVYDASVDEVEPTISRSRAEAALAAPFPGPDELVLYPDPVEQAAICGAAIVHRRPLLHSNKRVAYECMGEMLVPYQWPLPDEAEAEVAEKLDRLGERKMGDDEFVEWVRAHVGRGAWLRYQRRSGA